MTTPLATFEAHRSLLFSIAYRMLGSAMEAEDMLQEAYLRFQKVVPEQIESPRAFLTTLMTRLCINQLQSARAKREVYVGPWLPEPLLTENAAIEPLHDTLSVAFLILLEQLTPTERAVFLLREVFDYDYAEIAQMVSKEEAACRQLLSRAKKHIADNRPRFKPSPDEHRNMLERFLQAIGQGDVEGLMQLMADDITMWADGGGKARGAATRPVLGRAAVAQMALASAQRAGGNLQVAIEMVNHEAALVVRGDEQAIAVIFIRTSPTHIQDMWVVGNPDKLKHV